MVRRALFTSLRSIHGDGVPDQRELNEEASRPMRVEAHEVEESTVLLNNNALVTASKSAMTKGECSKEIRLTAQVS